MMHSQPMDGAMVMEPTDNLEMMFDMDVRLVNVRVVDSGNKPLSIGFKPMDGHARSFKVPVPALKPDNYTVHWTAMGEDGHRMSGSFQFMQH
ncbi:MAG: copper resistance protein CopC, partial [Oceanospirillales bacterium]|nr:copper resistance protein CopC [Oceanospirillales bacterium]